MKTYLRILAIETATEACSVAYQTEEGEIVDCFERIPQQHTRRLFPMIREVLAQAGSALPSIDALAVGRGPGSFTGSRIAVSVAQGLGFALNKPVYALSTLAAIAYQAREGLMVGDSIIVSPALDARMGEFYTGTYRISSNGASYEIDCIEDDHLTSAINVPMEILPRAKEIALLAQMAWEEGDLGLPAEKVLPVYLREKVV